MNKQTIIGCDPEVIWSMEGDGYSGMLPAGLVLNRLQKVGSTLITGSYKGYPCIETNNGLIFADGASWELNPNSGDKDELLENIRELLATSLAVKRVLSKPERRIHLDIKSAMSFDLEMLGIWNDEQLSIFGCDRDETIWEREVDPGDIDASTHNIRYFGGHIHIGYPLYNSVEFYEDMATVRRMVALADGILGLSGLVVDQYAKGGNYDRRRVYGQPGVYRPQPHGIEYRTIGNSWLLTPKFAENMLTLASYLPILFETDVPEYILTTEKRLKSALIVGKLSSAVSMLEHIQHMVKDNKLVTALQFFINRRDSYSYRNQISSWEQNWRLL